MILGVFLVILVIFFVIMFRLRRKKCVAFFHPNCLDCGGGEKVLWVSVKALQRENCKICIYSEDANYEKAKNIVESRFSLPVPESIEFINVGEASFIRPGRFPRFTLILQALSSMLYAFKCLIRLVPSVVIDTTGAPFAAPIWKIDRKSVV